MAVLRNITKGCYVLVFLSIVISTACAIFGVWVDNASDVAWRGVATGGILMGAACITVWANMLIEQHAARLDLIESPPDLSDPQRPQLADATDPFAKR